MEGCGPLFEDLVRALNSKASSDLVDLYHLEFWSMDDLILFVQIDEIASQKQKAFALARPGGLVAYLLDLVHLDQFLQIFKACPTRLKW